MSNEDRIRELKEELTALEMEEGKEEKEKKKITEKDVSKGCLMLFLGGIALFFGIAIIGIIIDAVQTTSSTTSKPKNSNWQTGDNPWDHPKAIDAQYTCARLVEDQFIYDYDWDGMGLSKFDRIRYSDGALTLSGDNIKGQNMFGAMATHVYQCKYQIRTGTAEILYLEMKQ